MCVQLGDRVKLTDRAARGRNSAKRGTRIDWSKRRGVVARKSQRAVYVIWDGLRSAEKLQSDFIQPAD